MTARLTDEELAKLERLEREAAGGPWTADHHAEIFWIWTPDHDQIIMHVSERHSMAARFVVCVRNALPSLLAEVREGRAFRASVYEAAGMPELPEYTLTAKDDAELVAYISDIRARSRRASGCQCQWEAGDSPCRVHGEDEPAEGGAT